MPIVGEQTGNDGTLVGLMIDMLICIPCIFFLHFEFLLVIIASADYALFYAPIKAFEPLGIFIRYIVF